jgi:uncharacterized membrane protein YfcA
MNKILKILSSLLIGIICGPLSVYLGIGTFTMTTILSLSGLVKDFRTAVGTTLLTVTTPALIFIGGVICVYKKVKLYILKNIGSNTL